MNKNVFHFSVIGLCFFAIIAALISEFQFGMKPCAWCILQRLEYVIIATIVFVNLFFDSFFLILMFSCFSFIGFTTAIYQNLVAAKSFTCGLSLAEKIISELSLDTFMPFLFKPEANCNEAIYQLFGIPFEIYSAILFLFLSFCGFIYIFKNKSKK